MLLAALRRFVSLLALVAGSTSAVSLALGAAAGASADRSVSVGLYGVGSFLVVAGFFVGNRGPVRPRQDAAAPLLGSRVMRWATPAEREESLNLSAVFVAVGIALILLGVLVDSRYRLI